MNYFSPHSVCIVLILILVVGLGWSIASTVHSPTVPVEEETSGFRFEVVTTNEARERGLSGRTDIPHDYGMLFVFDTPIIPGFWMKDMVVPIDIIWLADDGTILGIEDSVSPDSYPKPFYPPQHIRYVLETRAGEAKAKGWSVGGRIDLPDSHR